MLELQKIIPALQYDGEMAVLVFQNMYPGIVKYLTSYLDSFTHYATSSVLQANNLLGGQCLVGNCHGQREILFADGMPVLTGPKNDDELQEMNADSLLRSAAQIFGQKLSVLLLSGVEQDIKGGMEAVVTQGGKIILQDSDSSLLPRSLEQLRSFGMEECSLKPEEIAPYIASLI
jgi:chemotaxis response regulator CheB